MALRPTRQQVWLVILHAVLALVLALFPPWVSPTGGESPRELGRAWIGSPPRLPTPAELAEAFLADAPADFDREIVLRLMPTLGPARIDWAAQRLAGGWLAALLGCALWGTRRRRSSPRVDPALPETFR